MHQLNSLQDLFVHELRDLYSAEQQLVTALPKMANAATSTDLRETFNHHLEQTRNHVTRLESIFTQLGEPRKGEECEAMRGLIDEGEQLLETGGDTAVKDAALIMAAQKVEHYEIASYGTVRTFAEHLGLKDAAKLLQETLDEEGKTNKNLTKLAEGGIFGTGINERAIEA